MRKLRLRLSLILMQLTLALTPSEHLTAKLATCTLQARVGVNGIGLNQIAQFIVLDHPPARRKSRRLLSVGSKIDPHQKLKQVPAELVKALREYRGYGYFLSKAYVVIVHPPTRRISYLLPFCPISGGHRVKIEVR